MLPTFLEEIGLGGQGHKPVQEQVLLLSALRAPTWPAIGGSCTPSSGPPLLHIYLQEENFYLNHFFNPLTVGVITGPCERPFPVTQEPSHSSQERTVSCLVAVSVPVSHTSTLIQPALSHACPVDLHPSLKARPLSFMLHTTNEIMRYPWTRRGCYWNLLLEKK